METVRQILSVLVVFLLLGLALWKLRSGVAGGSAGAVAGAPVARVAGWFRARGGFGARGRERALERVDRLALTPQHMLHLVRVQGREVVVATHPQGCYVLTGLPEAEVVAPAAEHIAVLAASAGSNGMRL